MCCMNSTSAAVYGCRMLSARAWAIAAASASGLSVCAGVTGAALLLADLVAVVHADALSTRTAQKPPKCFLLIRYGWSSCGSRQASHGLDYYMIRAVNGRKKGRNLIVNLVIRRPGVTLNQIRRRAVRSARASRSNQVPLLAQAVTKVATAGGPLPPFSVSSCLKKTYASFHV